MAQIHPQRISIAYQYQARRKMRRASDIITRPGHRLGDYPRFVSFRDRMANRMVKAVPAVIHDAI